MNHLFSLQTNLAFTHFVFRHKIWKEIVYETSLLIYFSQFLFVCSLFNLFLRVTQIFRKQKKYYTNYDLGYFFPRNKITCMLWPKLELYINRILICSFVYKKCHIFSLFWTSKCLPNPMKTKNHPNSKTKTHNNNLSATVFFSFISTFRMCTSLSMCICK